MAGCWNTFKLVERWDDLDRILENQNKLFKCLSMFRIFRIDYLLPRVTIYDSAVDTVFLENTTSEITLNVYLVSITEILNTC